MKRFTSKIKNWYRASLIRHVIKCLYEISSKNTRMTVDYHITKLFNPKLAKNIDEMNAVMLAQSHHDREYAAELVESLRGTPEKILKRRGVLLPSEIAPELTMAQQENINRLKHLLDLNEGCVFPIISEPEQKDKAKKPVLKKQKVTIANKDAKTPAKKPKRLTGGNKGVTKAPVKRKRT